MTVKPIAAGTPQRIISKINEIIGAVNTNKGTADTILDAATIADAGKALGIDAEGDPALIDVVGAADAILDAATIADAGKALGIDAEGEPALIDVSGGASILVCNLTYTGTGVSDDPYVGHIDHAAELLDALDSETDYSPIIFIDYTYPDDYEPRQLTPAVVLQSTFDYEGTTVSVSRLQAYGAVSTTNLTLAFTIGIASVGGMVEHTVTDAILGINAEEWTVADDVLTYMDPIDS